MLIDAIVLHAETPFASLRAHEAKCNRAGFHFGDGVHIHRIGLDPIVPSVGLVPGVIETVLALFRVAPVQDDA